MKYIVLLRGINVGGNNIIKMADLKTCLEEAGFKNVNRELPTNWIKTKTNRTNTLGSTRLES